MPMIKTLDQAVAAGVTIFPWQGNQYEFLPFDAEIGVALLADTGDSWDASVFRAPTSSCRTPGSTRSHWRLLSSTRTTSPLPTSPPPAKGWGAR